MSNSPLVSYTKISPNKTSPRNHAIDTITIHCVVGQASIESLGARFAKASVKASSNYGIGADGRVGMYVEEKDRSWCSSNSANDNRAITIECASDATHPYAINDKVYASLIALCADICKRNGIKELKWKADKSLIGKPEQQNMTVHRWFANKSCPGDYIYERLGQIANEVNAMLKGGSVSKPVTPTTPNKEPNVVYRVQTGAFTNKINAENMMKKVKAAGFDTYMVKVGNTYKIQVGAYSKKPNADIMLKKLKAAGFDAFITTENGFAVNSPSKKKTVDELAREVIQGLWGVGVDRQNRLRAAGYDPVAVQNRVNELL